MALTGNRHDGFGTLNRQLGYVGQAHGIFGSVMKRLEL
jgi:hypothetical protein